MTDETPIEHPEIYATKVCVSCGQLRRLTQFTRLTDGVGNVRYSEICINCDRIGAAFGKGEREATLLKQLRESGLDAHLSDEALLEKHADQAALQEAEKKEAQKAEKLAKEKNAKTQKRDKTSALGDMLAKTFKDPFNTNREEQSAKKESSTKTKTQKTALGTLQQTRRSAKNTQSGNSKKMGTFSKQQSSNRNQSNAKGTPSSKTHSVQSNLNSDTQKEAKSTARRDGRAASESVNASARTQMKFKAGELHKQAAARDAKPAVVPGIMHPNAAQQEAQQSKTQATHNRLGLLQNKQALQQTHQQATQKGAQFSESFKQTIKTITPTTRPGK